MFIAIDEPVTPPPTLLAASDPGFEVGDLAVISTRGSAATVSDIFLDVAHFFFVHAVTFGADEFCEVPTYSGKGNDVGFRATYEHEFVNREDVGAPKEFGPCSNDGDAPIATMRHSTWSSRSSSRRRRFQSD